MIDCLAIFIPRCGQWVASVMKDQAPMWMTWLTNGHYTLREYACYVNVMSEVARCGMSNG